MKFIPDYGDPMEPKIRAKYAYLEAAVSIAGNVFLFIVKITIGFLIGSVSIIADAIHTLSDVGTSGVVVVGITAAKKEPDEGHPFGHGRYEYIATFIIAIILFLVAVELFIHSLGKFSQPTSIDIADHVILVYTGLLFGIIAKEAMARYAMALGKKIDSKMLEADAWHHRADSITTVGVIIALIFVQFDIPKGYGHLADPILGLAISVYIGYEAAKLAKESMDLLAGRSEHEGKMEKLVAAAEAVEGVEEVHDLYVHDYGIRCIVSLHVIVAEELNTKVSHRIASEVEEAIELIMNCEAVVHIEPCGGECSRDIERALVSILKATPEIVSYHSVRLFVDEDGGHITVHATVDKGMSVEDSHRLVHNIDEKLKESHPGYRVVIHVEPCEAQCTDCSTKHD